ncbi:CsbD family protein [Nitrococcus mobilis]|uniref:CsbD-like domain-containing protein n=1 Tax=Nitrococcus mobilis Nb-231 TaxID=314278 RepID=A4BP76_9GAMM|nr:hypothetical protein [Nitrococcus mobilis]EAR22377.1 hypothetical protein NB231_11594 [Nitrococcus mobilis Nb-231]
MSWNTVQGDWQRHVGQVRILWSRLTEGELQEINGRREKLIDKIHERYQVPKDLADEQVRIFENRFDEPNPKIEREKRGEEIVPGPGKALGSDAGT